MLFYDDLAEFISSQSEKLAGLETANIPEVGVVLDVLGPNENQDRDANPGRHLVTRRVDRLAIDCSGIEGDRHRGLTRLSTGRETLYRKNESTIVNRRQILAVSPYECELLSERLHVEITPQLLGANVVIGRSDGADYCLSDVPLYTHFVITSDDAVAPSHPPVATLVQYLQQKGCSLAGRAIAREYGDAELTHQFVAHAEHRRGILCSVEYPVDSVAFLERGQQVFFKFPMGCCY
ncbi:MAG: hypothetical protein CMJ75_21075 [Planctomycetaceae bacterium]|nr:hypothetical protein [Planctomycetaceae bacterium]